LIAITSADDPRIQAYCSVQERDLVGRDGLFIAEGEVVLRVLLRSPLMETLSVLVTQSRYASLSGELSKLPSETPVYIASQSVMDSIVGFHIHRGILALGRRHSIRAAHELLECLPPRCTILGLIGISNHDNMGGIFRNAAAFGASAIIADSSSCDPLYRKAIRVSVGGVFQVPYARLAEGEDIVDIFGRHGITPYALSPSGSLTLAELKASPRAGMLLGAEGPGLPQALMDRCETVRIPITGSFDSLNVATTSGIVLHHLASGLPG
jgi:tRNA G18 (ribose-2'-O)-methylase SpoU